MFDSTQIAVLTALEGAANYGVDPGAGYQGVLVNDGAEIQPQASKVQRTTVQAHRSPRGSFPGELLWTLKLPLELRGGGLNAGVLNPPEHDHLLRMCAAGRAQGCVLSMTSVGGNINPGDPITKTVGGAVVGTVLDSIQVGATATVFVHPLVAKPIAADSLTFSGGVTGTAATVWDSYVYYRQSDASAFDSGHIAFHWSRAKHIVAGARGTFALDVKSGGLGSITFDIKGLYTNPTNIALPTPAVYKTVPSRCVNMGVQIGAVDMTKTTTSALQISWGNNVVTDQDLNATDGVRQILITGIADGSGSIDPSVMDLGEFDPWAAWRAGTGTRLRATLGANPGERIHMLVTNAQYGDLRYGNRNQKLIYQLPFTPRGLADAGDDDTYLIYY